MLIYLIFKGIVFIALLFPDNIAYNLVRFVSYIAYLLDKKHRHIAYLNISKNLNRKYIKYSINQVIRNMYANFFQIPLDIELFKRRVRKYNWTKWIEGNLTKFDNIIKESRGCLLTTLHLGNWEVGGGLLSLLGYNMYVIAGTLNNTYLDKYLNNFRNLYGEEVVFKRGALESLFKNSNNKKFVLAMLTDQSARMKGINIKFLQDEAPTIKTPAILHKRWKTPIICGVSYRIKNFNFRFELIPLQIDKIESVENILLKINTTFAKFIETEPNQWLWIHRRWNYFYNKS